MPITINVTIKADVHVHTGDPAFQAKAIDLLNGLTTQGKSIMSALSDLQATVDEIDTATNTIAAEVTALQDQVANGISPTDAAAVAAKLGGIATRLQAIGTAASPAGNVPPTAPTPPAP